MSNIPASSPTIPRTIAYIPIVWLDSRSIIIPIDIPYIAPRFLLVNSPMNRTSIMNRFGFIPAMVNHSKKFTCKKYTIK